jgi:hypothetical protein
MIGITAANLLSLIGFILFVAPVSQGTGGWYQDTIHNLRSPHKIFIKIREQVVPEHGERRKGRR